MHGSRRRFWLVAGALLIASCLLKGWLVNRIVLLCVTDSALARASLDQELDAEPGPRILIAGGSNALSGYDSALITHSTGLPTFNVSLLNEGYAYQNAFQIVERHARTGDFVLFSTLKFAAAPPSDQTDYPTTRILGGEEWQVPQPANSSSPVINDYLPPIISLFSSHTLARLLVMWSHTQKIVLVSSHAGHPVNNLSDAHETEADQAESVNAVVVDRRGDWISCTQPQNPGPLTFYPSMVVQTKNYLAALDAFAGRLQARGITLRVTPATILVQDGTVERWRQQYRTQAGSLRTAVMLPVDPSRQLLTDASRFCDSPAHLLRKEIAGNNQAVVDAVRDSMSEPAQTGRLQRSDVDGAV